jgi:hypothetical protein
VREYDSFLCAKSPSAGPTYNHIKNRILASSPPSQHLIYYFIWWIIARKKEDFFEQCESYSPSKYNERAGHILLDQEARHIQIFGYTLEVRRPDSLGTVHPSQTQSSSDYIVQWGHLSAFPKPERTQCVYFPHSTISYLQTTCHIM